MKTRINSNYNKKVLVRGNSLSDVNTLTENEMMLYTEQKDNEPVTKVVPSKIITKINGETKSYKVGETKIIKNDTTSFKGKDIYPIYIYSANKLPFTERYESDNALTRYESSCIVNIDNLLRKKIKRFYLLFYMPELWSDYIMNISLFVRESDEDLLPSTILHYQDYDDYNISYLGHKYTLWEIDITDKKNIIIKKASRIYIAASNYFTLDGTYYFYSPQKHQYLTLDTRFTGDKSLNSFYLFKGLINLDFFYRTYGYSPTLYIPIERIRKNNYRSRTLSCDITVSSSKEVASLIEAKLNYRNYSIRGFNSDIKTIVEVRLPDTVPNDNIYRFMYYESIEFKLNITLLDSDNKNYSLEMYKTISVITLIK